VQKAKIKLDHLGATLDPHACFLLHRGIKTLSLRVARQNKNALALATFLEQLSAVSGVNYPGLVSHPDHQRAKSLFTGYGGLLSFAHVGGAEGAHAMIDRLELATEAVSLGGVETLITIPAESTHAGLSTEECEAFGIGAGLVRLAVGIESEQDLIQDFASALQ
jgi:cystathionine beta-lyase/cystathionine gamma-synthase